MNDKTIHLGGGLISPPALRVFKYPLPRNEGTVAIPRNANITSCQLQNGMPTLWAEVDPNEKETVDLSIRYVMTGGEVPSGHQHLATFLTAGDSFVTHVYMRVLA